MSYTQRHSHESLPPRPRSEYKEKKKLIFFLHASSVEEDFFHPSFPSGIICDVCGRVSTFFLSNFRILQLSLFFSSLSLSLMHIRKYTHIRSSLVFPISLSTIFHFSMGIRIGISPRIDRFSSLALTHSRKHSLTHTCIHAYLLSPLINKIVRNIFIYIYLSIYNAKCRFVFSRKHNYARARFAHAADKRDFSASRICLSLSPSLFSFLLFHPIYIAIIRNVNLISQLKTKLVTTYLRRTPRVSRSRRKNLHKSWFIREGMKNDMNKNNMTRESNAKRGSVDVGRLSESCCQQRNCTR